MSEHEPLPAPDDLSDSESKASSAMIDAIDAFIGSLPELSRKGSCRS